MHVLLASTLLLVLSASELVVGTAGQGHSDPSADKQQVAGEDSCPASRFTEAVELVGRLLPGAVKKLGGADAVLHAYLARRSHRACATSPVSLPAAWQLAGLHRDGLLINAGAGTSGTVFIDCVIDKGTDLRAEHGPTLPDGCMDSSYNRSASVAALPPHKCASTLAQWDFVSDSPVPYLFPALILSSQRGTVTPGGVLLTVRRPIGARVSAEIAAHLHFGRPCPHACAAGADRASCEHA